MRRFALTLVVLASLCASGVHGQGWNLRRHTAGGGAGADSQLGVLHQRAADEPVHAGYNQEPVSAGYTQEPATPGYTQEPATAGYATEANTQEPATPGYTQEPATTGYATEANTANTDTYSSLTSSATQMAGVLAGPHTPEEVETFEKHLPEGTQAAEAGFRAHPMEEHHESEVQATEAKHAATSAFMQSHDEAAAGPQQAEGESMCSSGRFIPAIPTVDFAKIEAMCEKRKEPGFNGKVVLVTGTAGFVAYHTAGYLAERGDAVIGLDSFNDYYPVSLKEARAADLEEKHGVYTVRGDLNDAALLEELFRRCEFTHVVHLAAQAGVRYAAKNPTSYVDSNIAGTVRLFEVIKAQLQPPAVVYASSSSVYGENTEVPFSELHRVDRPASLYAATKRANELFANVYHHIAHLSLTGLRFFTVYGPWGRPDMAAFKFAKAICQGTPIKVFQGPEGTELSRDFTYIDDIVKGVVGSLDSSPPSIKGQAALRLFNLGNTSPHTVTELVDLLEEALGKKGNRQYMQMPALGDVMHTHANISIAQQAFNYAPSTSLKEGLQKFADWFYSYYGPDGTNFKPDEINYQPLRR